MIEEDSAKPDETIAPDASPILDQPQNNGVPGIWHAIFFLILFYVLGVLFLLPLLALGRIFGFSGSSSAPVSVWFDVISISLTFALLLAMGKRWARRPWREILPFVRFWHPALLAIIPFTMGLITVMSEVDNITRFIFPMPDFIKQAMEDLLAGGIASVVALIVAAPLTEEAFFRGFVMNGFLKRYTPAKAIVISSIFFAIYHINPYQMIGAFAAGLFLGYLRVTTKSLWPCVAMHALNNALAYGTGFIPWPIPGLNTFTAGSFQPLWLDGLGAALLLLGGIPLYRFAATMRSCTSTQEFCLMEKDQTSERGE